MSNLKLWPQDYARSQSLTKGERFLLKNAEANLGEGEMVVGIDPVSLRTEKIQYGFYLSRTKGLITFSIFQDKLDISQIPSYCFLAKMAEEKLSKRLLDSQSLIARKNKEKFLKFPYKHMLLFPNESYEVMFKDGEKMGELIPIAAYRFFVPFTAKEKIRFQKDLELFKNMKMPADAMFKEFSETEIKSVFERLAPEYTVVLNEKVNTEIKAVTENMEKSDSARFEITGKETAYRTFLLDEYQVKAVNDMGTGHRVLLANPGAGKSVLLLSRAFKYASLYKESCILLTCYNKPLSDAYLFKAAQADYGTSRHFYTMTFHKLVKMLLEDFLQISCQNGIPSENEIELCIQGLKKEEIKIRFKAIFIDEVQIFDPKYLELCYALLEKSEDALFLMAGD